MAGIYIHIPFCRQACNYCNFHFSTSLQQKDELLTALTREMVLKTQKEGSINRTIETIYLGGGTPSILPVDDIMQIMDTLHQQFSISNTAEITLEANPDDITEEKLQQWKKAGINRFSIGVQSFLEAELVWMNRAHTAAESLACIDKVLEAGYDNFSVDLIYGSPLLSNDDWKRNVEILFQKNIPHISCYALTVEPATALDKQIAQHKKQPVDPERQAAQFSLLMDWMEQGGYEHYEISNFAKPGMRSRHNSSYWQGKPYHGFGPSAHSFDGKARRWNIANNALYIQSLNKDLIPFEEELLTPTQQLNEYIMTALRTMEGVDLVVVNGKFGSAYRNQLLVASGKWVLGGKLVITAEKIILTKEGKLFADGIAADLFFD